MKRVIVMPKKKFYKTNTALTVFLFLLYSIVPACYFFGDMAGYELDLKNELAWAWTVLLVGGITTILMFIFTWKKVYKVGGVCACLCILMTEANWYVYGYLDTTAMFVVAFTFIFGVMIWVRFSWPMAMKVLCAAIAVLLLPILSFFSLTAVIFDKNEDVIVQQIESPSGDKYFEVVNESKAEGSKYTGVYVYEKNADIDCALLNFKKKPVRVKYDKVDEFSEKDVKWIDENTLSVNGEHFVVK